MHLADCPGNVTALRNRGLTPICSTYQFNSGFLQDAAHAVGELVVELHELGRVLVAVLELVVGEELAPGAGPREPAEHVFPVRDVLLRDGGRRYDPAHQWQG